MVGLCSIARDSINISEYYEAYFLRYMFIVGERENNMKMRFSV